MDIVKNKNKILAIIMIVLLSIIALSIVGLINKNTLNQIAYSYVHEAGQELTLNPAVFFEVDEEKVRQIKFDTSAVDKDVVGEYVVTAKFKNKSFEIKVKVVDTTAPMVEFANRYVFTNDIENANFDDTFDGVYDASEWSARLIRFERKGNLEVMDETVLKSYTDTIPLPGIAEELEAIGTTDIPTEEGVYRAVMEIADVHGNTTLEEVYVIYDVTGARIDDTPDKTVVVTAEDLDKEPVPDKSDYHIVDNVDGEIDEEDIICELELRDADKHEWLVNVSYVDRAGNESKAVFLIIVEEGNVQDEDDADSNDDNDNGGGSSNDNDDNSNDDTDDDVVTDEEAAEDISPYEQMVIDAGYGVVVAFGDGDYAVLTHGDGYVNGKDGFDILTEYLTSLGLEATRMSGCWIDSENDWYWYLAYDVHEIDDEDSFDGGEIEFID